MHSTSVVAWLLAFILGFAASQPLFGLEKQLLYSFQDPDEFEIINKRSPLLSLVGSNVRFTEPFRNRVLNKKIRSVDARPDFRQFPRFLQ
ncbi:Protein CBG21268 [Caenorhabditis briggsae]|uniref:Uncharacterized protein n=2 Tax=Caenorhabditis briggsae TaxID=6238 RepID=A0AAE9AHB8_CAEBR|nr:Protein CBG21268 [Caenorhabditis briggsae]ULT97319.1 hypothetical protein L3Y34_005261 [Caenorhabditis briggsae]UMM30478.1 hypothetical protein L5515_012345 [Caenorhabditis briggsae]CAP38123.1 Protein CBG21268 [Caenorhabditis briggsae]